MASAFVTGVRAGGKGPEGFVAFVIACTYTGSDVAEEIEGHSYDVPVLVASGFTPAQLKTAMTTAAVAQGIELGLTVASISAIAFSVASVIGWGLGLWGTMTWGRST